MRPTFFKTPEDFRAWLEETRERRLATLIEDSEHGRTIKQLTRKK